MGHSLQNTSPPQRLSALVTRCTSAPGISAELSEAINEMANRAVRFLGEAGIDTILVDATHPLSTPHDALADHDILVVMGGADVDPQNYGRNVESATVYGLNAAADQFEIRLMQGAIKAGRTVLGICRGMQLLNVACGGSLIQELGAGTMHNATADNTAFVDHDVEIVPSTVLDEVYGERVIRIRSGHHQAVDVLGKGLRVAALASDGVAEAIELDGPNLVLGMQWHPEAPDADPQHIRKLLSAIVHRQTAQFIP